MARPQKEIDWNLFEQLCGLQCIQTEIASCLKIDHETLANRAKEYYGEDNYSNIYKRFSENGKCSLRRNQFVLSKKNASMAIWLGKIWLGQKDPNCEETREILNDAREAIREIQNERRTRPAERSFLENQQSLPHQGCSWQQDQIPDELGAGDSMERGA